METSLEAFYKSQETSLRTHLCRDLPKIAEQQFAYARKTVERFESVTTMVVHSYISNSVVGFGVRPYFNEITGFELAKDLKERVEKEKIIGFSLVYEAFALYSNPSDPQKDECLYAVWRTVWGDGQAFARFFRRGPNHVAWISNTIETDGLAIFDNVLAQPFLD